MIQLKGLISLKDQFSRPMKGATTAMNDFNRQAKLTRDANGRLRDEFGRFAKSGPEAMSAVGKSVAMLGATTAVTFGAIGAGITAALGSAVNTAMTFEAAMSKVGAVSGATGKDLQSLENLARQMGATTQFSANNRWHTIEKSVA